MTDNNLAAAGELALPELRYAVAPITNVEVREPSESYDNTWTMSGYAAVFDEQTVLYDGRFARITEDIDPAAFDVCLREQGITTPAGVVHFNPNHDMSRAVASTKVPAGAPGSLTIRVDSKGLFYTARVSRDDPDAVAMAAKLRTGVWDQASFAFTIKHAIDSDIDDGDTIVSHRRIMQVGHLYDVCACPQGAYAQTVSQLRSYAAAGGHRVAGEEEREAITIHHPFDRTSEAGTDVRPELSGSVVVRRLTAAQLRGVARHKKD